VSYVIDEEATAALAKGPLWAQNSAGPGTRTSDLAAAAWDAAEAAGTYAHGSTADRAAQSVRDTVASGYVGLRYGAALPKGDPLLSKTRFFGLLLEIRGGPLDGLRYYYDKLPEAAATQPSAAGTPIQTSIGWSRHEIGYSFSFSPGLLADEISLTPKLGIWNFDAVSVIERDSAGNVVATQDFKVGRALSLGVELGATWLSRWYTLRPWVGYDRGIPLIKNGESVSSMRGGIDAFLPVGPPFRVGGASFKTALLIFALSEKVTLADPAAASAPPTEAEVETYSYAATYFGGGIALSW
jgi:hypothetical protein